MNIMNIISTVINFTKNLMENNIENSTQETTDDNIKYNNIIFYCIFLGPFGVF